MNKQKEYQEFIVKLLTDAGYEEEAAKELAFNLAEMDPDLRRLLEKFDRKTLTVDDLEKIFVHIPYHVSEAKRLIFERKR